MTSLLESAAANHRSKVAYTTWICVVTAVLLYPLVYIGNYGGDSQVHLVFGQNAAEGNFFEFNPGENSPGETSPGYMMLLAGYFQLVPDVWVPALVKATNLFFWYALVYLVYVLAKKLTQSSFWTATAVVVSGVLPGSVYNGTNGMENGIFAFFILFWIYTAMRMSWFARVDTSQNEIVLGTLLGIACWIRPEGFVICALALVYRGFIIFCETRTIKQTLFNSIIFLSPFLVITGSLAYFHWHYTGYILPVSGTSRILMSNLDPNSFNVWAVNFNPKFTIRLAQYFPLTLPAVSAIFLILAGRYRCRENLGILGFLAVVFGVFFILYSFVLSSVHLSRYIIFVMPAVILLAAVGGNWFFSELPKSWERYPKHIAAFVVAMGIVFLTVIFSYETNLRLKLDTPSSLWVTMKAPSERTVFGNELLDQLGPDIRLPVSIAMQEVQARYWMDSRFIVRSLDGRIDPLLTGYVTESEVDHVSYLKQREVQFLVDTPNYNKDKALWSLKKLEELQENEELTYSGTTFRKLPIDRSSRDRALLEELHKPLWSKGSIGTIRAHFFLVNLVQVSYEDH